MRHAWLLQEWGPAAAEAARGARVEVLCPRANALTPEAVREMRAAGYLVRAWGVKTPEVRAARSTPRIADGGDCCPPATRVGCGRLAPRLPAPKPLRPPQAPKARPRRLGPHSDPTPRPKPPPAWRQLLLHVAACGAHGATVNWPLQAAELLAGAGSGPAGRA